MGAGAEDFLVGFVDGGSLVDVWLIVSCAVAELVEVFGVKYVNGNWFW